MATSVFLFPAQTTFVGNGWAPAGGVAAITGDETVSGNQSIGGLLTSYDGISTAGLGIPIIRDIGHFDGLIAAKTPVTSYTPSIDATLSISVFVLVTVSNAENFTINAAYTDVSGTVRSFTLPLRLLTGVNTLVVNFINGTIPYAGTCTDIRIKGGTTLTLSTTGTFTGCTYNICASIKEIDD